MYVVITVWLCLELGQWLDKGLSMYKACKTRTSVSDAATPTSLGFVKYDIDA